MSSIRRATLIAMVFAAAASQALSADPDAAPAPTLQIGNTWVYDVAVQKGTNGFNDQRIDRTIERIGSDSMVVGVKPDGSPANYEDHIVGLDWSLRLVVDGKEVTTGRPFVFPMRVGSNWTADYDDMHPYGQQISAHFHRTYKVVDWEDIVVPAGKFHVMKVESNGTVDAKFAASASGMSGAVSTTDGTTTFAHLEHAAPTIRHFITYEELYYSPETKYFVKSIEEQYNSENILARRETQTLLSYTPHP